MREKKKLNECVSVAPERGFDEGGRGMGMKRGSDLPFG